MTKVAGLTFALLLTAYLTAQAHAQQCNKDPNQASLIAKVYKKLASLSPSTREFHLGRVGCPLNKFPSLEAAIDRCSCRPEFGCDIIIELLKAGKIEPANPAVIACT